MGKKSRRKKVARQGKPFRAPIPPIARPFEGMECEAQLVAMRELIPAATLPATTTSDYGSRAITIVTLLPDAAPAMVRSDGEVLLALQTRSHSGDAGHDLGVALAAALALKDKVDAGEADPNVVHVDVRDPGPRIVDMIEGVGELTIEDDLGFWLAPGSDDEDEVRAAIEESAKELVPTAVVPGVENTYWHRMNKIFVRWVRDEDETKLFTALARLQVKEQLTLGHDSRFIGAFRALGLSIPVFEFPGDVEADDLTEAAQQLEKNLEAALAVKDSLTDDERRARSGLVSRQVSLR